MAQILHHWDYGTGFINGNEVFEVEIDNMAQGAVHIPVAYPEDGVIGVELTINNVRHVRNVDENFNWRWDLRFDIVNLGGNGIVFHMWLFESIP